MKAVWDPDADAVSFDLSKSKRVDGKEVAPGVILHYDKNDRVVEIEILKFSKRFSNLKFPDVRAEESVIRAKDSANKQYRLVLTNR